VNLDGHKIGCNNNEPLGGKKLVVTTGTKLFSEDLEKRGWDLVEVPYETIIQPSAAASTALLTRFCGSLTRLPVMKSLRILRR